MCHIEIVECPSCTNVYPRLGEHCPNCNGEGAICLLVEPCPGYVDPFDEPAPRLVLP